MQIVARGVDGSLRTARETATGFTAWTDISGGNTFTGSPDAVLDWGQGVQVVARTTGGSVVRSGETAPGSATWNPWSAPLGTSVLDPVAASGTSDHAVLLVDAAGVGKLVRFQPGA
ncbi:hypothetical protein JOD54_002015 [Actinokineospora baliensis]|uniref:hypothetical protein n=1 Tax=Actinokineospora baliensis TaxID=547056 RepID=UPI00195AECC2|nr:hypothetical protein [Actinokineospora baliensis]MBM7771811.1 hypothetical protein [Actinokineospora baliensis]